MDSYTNSIFKYSYVYIRFIQITPELYIYDMECVASLPFVVYYVFICAGNK